MSDSPDISGLSDVEYGYLTTTGRNSGLPREIEIWFGVNCGKVYMLSGNRDRSNWVRNFLQNPAVTFRISGKTLSGSARTVEPESDEDVMARRLLVGKYQPGHDGDLTEWGQTALPVAIEINNIQE